MRRELKLVSKPFPPLFFGDVAEHFPMRRTKYTMDRRMSKSLGARRRTFPDEEELKATSKSSFRFLTSMTVAEHFPMRRELKEGQHGALYLLPHNRRRTFPDEEGTQKVAGFDVPPPGNRRRRRTFPDEGGN